jgi:hypothetical protein
MAKKQAFGDKALKQKAGTGDKTIKLVYSTKSAKTGEWRFAERFVKIPAGGNEDAILKDAIAGKI